MCTCCRQLILTGHSNSRYFIELMYLPGFNKFEIGVIGFKGNTWDGMRAE